MGARLTIAGHHKDRLQLANELGADIVVNNTTEEGSKELERHKPYSVIFECSGGDGLDQIIGVPGNAGLVGQRSHARLILTG